MKYPRLSLLFQLLLFLKKEKKWFLTPLLLVLILIGLFFVFVQGSAFAPLLYTIF